MDFSVLSDVLDCILSVVGIVLFPYLTFFCIKFLKTELNQKDEGDK